MYKFNNNDIFTFYLKGMLHKFNLPSYEALTVGKLVYKDNYYIYRNFILKALKTFTVDGIDLNDFKVIQDNYVFGNKLTNITKNLNLNSLYYDAYTHNYLGKYLRFYRDYTGINLMSLYNCFSETSITDITIEDLSGNIILTSDDNSVVYMVDIIPGTEYTMYLDCKGSVEIAAGYYDNDLININHIELPPTDTPIVFPYEKTYFKISNTTFNKPFIYNKLQFIEDLGIQNSGTLYNWRSKLKLFIKLPKDNQSSIVILEGNYLKSSSLHFDDNNLVLPNVIESKPYINTGDEDNYTPDKSYQLINAFNWVTKSQLICINGTTNYPFSDRLVEYLINNCITSTDEISDNISRVQDKLIRKSNPGLNKIKLRGVWDDSIRSVIYGLTKTSNLLNTRYDLLGYVDKDVESLLNLRDGE